MPAFRRPFDPAAVQVGGEHLVTLPDRYRSSPPPTRIARFEGCALWLLELTSGTPFDVFWPARGGVRTVDLAAADGAALGLASVVELAPLPFGIAATLRALTGGAPTFYLGYPATYPEDHELVGIDDPAANVDRLVIGAVFQDRVTRTPAAWLDAIGDALATGDPAAAAPWRTLLTLFGAAQPIQLLDDRGRPLAGETLSLSFVAADGSATGPVDATSDQTGRLGPEATAPSGARSRIRCPGRELPLLVHLEGARAGTTAPAIPDPAGISPPELDIAAGAAHPHVQLLDVGRWLAPVTPAPPPQRDWPARFRSRSVLEPLIDGHASYARLVPELRAADVTGGGAYFMGWAFKDFELQPGDSSTTLPELVEAIRRNGDVRILAAQMFQPRPGAMQDLSVDVAVVLLALFYIAQPLTAISRANDATSPFGDLLLQSALVVAVALALTKWISGEPLGDLLRGKVEQTADELMARLNRDGTVAHWSRHPAGLADNPLFGDILLPDGRHLSELVEHFSVFHNKVQLVKRRPSDGAVAAADGFEYGAYIGGVDINVNRLDSPGHQGAAHRDAGSFAGPSAHSYHDVHARVGGAATVDAFGMFRDRYLRDTGAEPPFPPPAVDAFAGFPGEHLVQVSQTAFRAASPADGFDWAPDGDRTNWETFRRAIAAAREYIYIEDQYFVPDDGYVAALREAARHCQRLVILTPSTLADIPFGEERRQAIFQTLAAPDAWGDRVLVGSPFRRPVLDAAARTASTGRLTLLAGIGPADTEVLVGPPARTPAAERFFVWIGGELMFVIGKLPVAGPDGNPAMRLEVIRGGVGTQPRWCPTPRGHRTGEPVTAARPFSIYVHAKMMVVDDVFVAVGSMNLDRRGFFHDGEMVASALPAALAAAPDNPARRLRVALWAEHLGIDPAMGEALLGDPIAAFELFRRSRYQGNRFTPFREFLLPHAEDHLPELVNAILPVPVGIAIEAAIQGVLQADRTKIYNTIADPTSGVDPDPRPGPDLPV